MRGKPSGRTCNRKRLKNSNAEDFKQRARRAKLGFSKIGTLLKICCAKPLRGLGEAMRFQRVWCEICAVAEGVNQPIQQTLRMGPWCALGWNRAACLLFESFFWDGRHEYARVLDESKLALRGWGL
jgi:hypothetical protein